MSAEAVHAEKPARVTSLTLRITLPDGIPAGKYTVTVVQRRPLVLANGKAGPNQLPEKYASATTSGIAVEVKEGDREFRIDLEKAK